VFCYLSSVVLVLISSGARPAVPMGVAPEAIVEFFLFGCRLKDICSFLFFHRHILQEFSCFFFVLPNRRSYASDKISPLAMSGFLLETIIVSGLVCLTYNFIDFTRYS
jgi:hypothetical protein